MVSASLQEVFHYLAVARAIDSEMIKCGEQSIKRHGIRDKAIISQGRVVQQEKLLHAIGRPRAKEISMQLTENRAMTIVLYSIQGLWVALEHATALFLEPPFSAPRVEESFENHNPNTRSNKFSNPLEKHHVSRSNDPRGKLDLPSAQSFSQAPFNVEFVWAFL